METQNTTGISRRELMTTKEAAEYLGVSMSTLYKMTHNRVIPYYKPTGRISYFNRADLDAWMTSTRVSTVTELNTMAEAHLSNLNSSCR